MPEAGSKALSGVPESLLVTSTCGRWKPRLAPVFWMRPLESLFRTLCLYHFRLGEAAG